MMIKQTRNPSWEYESCWVVHLDLSEQIELTSREQMLMSPRKHQQDQRQSSNTEPKSC